jgi:hypothetical protein
LAALLMLAVGTTALAQDPNNASQAPQSDPEASSLTPATGELFVPPGNENPGYLPPGTDPEDRLLIPFFKHMVRDQTQFWTSSKDLAKPSALKTFVPFAGFTGLLIAGDSWVAQQVPDKPNQLTRSRNISDYATFSLIGAAAGAYGWGHLTHNDHLSETGFLSGEAALNSLLIAYAFKEITQRERPYQGNGHGNFLQGGSSFLSEHSALAWSTASVIAHEYPSRLTQIAVYGLASAVTLTRVTGKEHFPSDAFVGSVLGWYLGRQVYRAHHDPELGGAPWGDLAGGKTEGSRNPANMASPYVPLESWVYPALTRLAALGYVESAYLGMRPWTRMECARMLDEASDHMRDDGAKANSPAQKIIAALEQEFRNETERLDDAASLGATLDSVYTRVTEISGAPLRDGYHFAQTLVNDYGRPYSEGFNNVTGFSTSASAGPLAFYLRGEYQHTPASASDPLAALQGIANADVTLPVPNASPNVDRFHLIDSLVAFRLQDVQLSFGKQSVWLGPGESGPLLFSNNADSMLMVKIESTTPYRIPLLSRILGPVRTEFFLGQLAGQQFELNGSTLLGPGNINPQPYLHGDKISFKPTPDLEFGMGFTAQFAGPGLPFTWNNFLRTYYAHTSGPTTNNNNPGKRLSALDFSYRVPWLRNWLTIYGDSLVVDEISPITSSRTTINPGIYLPQIPKIPKLEWRAEYLRTSQGPDFAPGYVYFGVRRYRSGYTNEGNLLASWIGRAGIGGQSWLTYSVSARTHFQLSYRHQEVNKNFIEGGRLNDFSAHADVMLSHALGFSGMVQYEQWRFPILSPSAQADITSSLQLTFYPRWQLRK